MPRPSVRALAPFALLATLSLLAACGGDGGTTGGAGTVRVLLTDAPFPYDSVASVQLYVESVAASATADTTHPQGQQWKTIAEPRRRFDLLALQRGATALLGEAQLPAGQYRAVRLVLNTDSSSVTDRRGSAMDVRWQSSQGRVALHALVEEAVDASAGGSVVIDLDVGRSFVCPGDACGRTLLFIPWFRAVNTAATGAIAGTVRAGEQSATATPLANATVTVLGTPGDWVVATGATDAQGGYHVPFLRAGRYRVRVDPPRGAAVSAAVRDTVAVVAGQATSSIDFRLTPASATGAQLLLTANGPTTIAAGDSTFFTAYLVRPGPDSLSQDYTVTWGSANVGVAVASAKAARVGRVVGTGPGTATITATGPSGITASALVTVVARRPVESVELALPRATVAVGDSVTAVATARDADGQPVPNVQFAITVSDSTVLLPRGVYSGVYFLGTAKKPGTATITATASGKTASRVVTVQ